MRQLFKNIKTLVQVREQPIAFLSGNQMQELPMIENAYLLVEDGIITDYGPMNAVPTVMVDRIIDLSGSMVFPSWCDSHTHLVYAGNREGEFVDRIRGLSYAEIAKRGGGIVNSAKLVQNSSEALLYEQSKTRLEEIIKLGTGAVEIKSGYGLSPLSELKMLRVIQKLKLEYNIPIKATFLAGHAIPPEYKHDRLGFIQNMLEKTLPTIAEGELAAFIDVFCELGYFDTADTNFILEAAAKYGLQPKIHVNQFTVMGGVKVGVANNARSVDHLELVEEDDIKALKGSTTMPVALPGCSFFLGIPYTPARRIIDAGLPLALASDYNPGSAPSGNMNFVVAAACIKMKMLPEEAINAATINGAYAMGLEKEVGSITKGKQANFFSTKSINSIVTLGYNFGSNVIQRVFIHGEEINLNQHYESPI